MLPRQVMTYSTLKKEGLTKEKIKNLSASLKIFPTPFKGIYYIPTKIERDGCFIDNANMVFKRALSAYLSNDNFYYSCRTAEEFWGIKWQPLGEVHVVNENLSRTIDMRARQKRNENKTTWRAKRIAKILSIYGNKIIFHRAGASVSEAKIKRTPNGNYAMKSQIKKDKKRFREKS